MAVDESVTVKGSPVRSLQKFIDAELTPSSVTLSSVDCQKATSG